MSGFRRIAALALIVVLALAGPAPAEDRFFSAVEDLPVMPGLVEKPRATVVFEKPEGRIVEVVAEGGATAPAVRAYYDRVLPALGWTRAADGTWHREAERLRLALAETGAGVALRITITPE